MEHFIVLSCLLAVTTGLAAPVYNSNVVDRRESGSQVSSPSTTEELYHLINETLDRATQGIRAPALSQAALAIAVLAHQVLVERGANNVSKDEIKKLVNEVAAELRIETSVSSILEDPLTAEGKYVETELRLLNRLSHRAQQLQAAGESIDVHVAAIQAVANSLDSSVFKVAGFVKLVAGETEARGKQEQDVGKRQWSGGVNGHYNGHSDWGVGGSLKYQSPNNKLSLGLDGHYGSGGWGANLGLTYRFRRR